MTILVVGLTAGLLVQPSCGKTLDDVVRQALSTNPRIAVLIKSREGIEHDLRQARSLYLPQVDFSAGFGRQRSDNTTTRGYASPSISRDYFNREEAQLQLVQRLFDGFDADSQVERQKARETSAANRVSEDLEFLALDVVNVYLEVLRQRDLIKLAEENVKRHDLIINSLKEREGQGGGNVGDVTQGEGRLARAHATLLQTQNDLLDAEALYQRLVGEAVEAVEEPRVPKTLLPRTVDEAVSCVRTDNPTLRIFEADVKVAQRQLEGTAAAFYPKVTLEATGSRNEDYDSVSGTDQTYQSMVRLHWNVYRGGSDTATRDAARSRLAAAESQRDNAILDAVEKMHHAWNSMETNHQKAKLYDKAIKFNKDTLDIYKQQFELLIRTLLDVLDADNELFTSETQLVAARISALSASYRVLALCGRLRPALGAIPANGLNPGGLSPDRHLVD